MEEIAGGVGVGGVGWVGGRVMEMNLKETRLVINIPPTPPMRLSDTSPTTHQPPVAVHRGLKFGAV